jgi:acyl-CoA thioesterase-1
MTIGNLSRMKNVARRYGTLRRLYQSAVALALVMLSQAGAALAASPPPRTIMAFGDSLTAGYQLRPGEGFAPQLEKALRARGRNVTVINAGVSGDTTAQGKARIGWGLAGLKSQGKPLPDLVIQPPATAKANLDAMIKDFKARGIRVILAGMLAQPNLGPAYAREFNSLYPALAKANAVTLYPFFMDGVATVPGMQLSDGLHPTARGVTVIVNKMLPTVLRELDALPR